MKKHIHSRPLHIKDYFLSQETFSVAWEENNEVGRTLGVDEKTLTHYYESQHYASHQNKKKGFKGIMYNWVQQRMLRYKHKLIEPLMDPNGILLDYGCGVGDFIYYLSAKGLQVLGTEPYERAQNMARSRGLRVAADMDAFSENHFAAITLWHVLEHIPNVEATLKKFSKALDDEGLLVLALPNPNAWDADHYKGYWAAWDVPRHLWHFSPKGIRKLLDKAGFECISTHPLPYDAFYVSLLSEGYKGNRFPWLKAFKNGLYSNYIGKKTGDYSSLIYIFRKR